MNYLDTIILAGIEGITEFLPISSTGHLILAAHALKIPSTEFIKSFEIIIQLGAILAVVVLYWRKLLTQRSLWSRLFMAFLPTAIVGFTLYPFIKNVLLSSPLITLFALLLGGIALIVVEKMHHEQDHHVHDLSHLTYRQAILIGIFQSLAVIPGISRAAATIIGGMLVGTKRKAAVEFSFLLAIPTMAAATGLDLLKSSHSYSLNEVQLLSIGFVTAFIVALLAVKYFVRFIQHHTFVPFGIYRIVLAVAYWFILLK